MGDVIDLYGRRLAADRPSKGYEAFVVSEEAEPSVVFVFNNDRDYVILAYADLERIANPPGVEPNSVVVLRFGGSVKHEVRIEGYRLLDVVTLLRRHRIASVQETPRKWSGPKDGSVPVITRIMVREVRH
jgi:hypothetical protein